MAQVYDMMYAGALLQGMPQDGLWYCCAHMPADTNVGAPIIRMHEEVPQPTPLGLVCS